MQRAAPLACCALPLALAMLQSRDPSQRSHALWNEATSLCQRRFINVVACGEKTCHISPASIALHSKCQIPMKTSRARRLLRHISCRSNRIANSSNTTSRNIFKARHLLTAEQCFSKRLRPAYAVCWTLSTWKLCRCSPRPVILMISAACSIGQQLCCSGQTGKCFPRKCKKTMGQSLLRLEALEVFPTQGRQRAPLLLTFTDFPDQLTAPRKIFFR